MNEEGASGNMTLGVGIGLVLWAALALGIAFAPASVGDRSLLIVVAVLFVPICCAVFSFALVALDNPSVPAPIRWTARTVGYALIAPMILVALAGHRKRREG